MNQTAFDPNSDPVSSWLKKVYTFDQLCNEAELFDGDKYDLKHIITKAIEKTREAFHIIIFLDCLSKSPGLTCTATSKVLQNTTLIKVQKKVFFNFLEKHKINVREGEFLIEAAITIDIMSNKPQSAIEKAVIKDQ
ncbi:MAG: hypothetical protein CO139_00455 [Candidatus Moranbacteria bacterium CG_4_9_14_3_um_filter_36_9]|nr:MAG: hypothetical protein CO139_00455 [Candidatus Moranbacteria bacterium CG_4_9_14_3_um_filter_36_9]